MEMDIPNIYLNTRLDRYKYMQLHTFKDIPQVIIDEYNLMDNVAADGYI